jgi:hypothetical protein
LIQIAHTRIVLTPMAHVSRRVYVHFA